MKFFNKKQSDVPRRRLENNEVSEPITNSSDAFRRNRTLSGVLAPNVNSPRTHVHHLTIKRRKVFSTLLVVVITSFFLWTLVSNFTAVATVTTSDAAIIKHVDTSRYEKAIQEYLDINPMERFHFLLNSDALISYMSNKLPEVSKITQRGMTSIGSTEFSIKMRQSVAGWIINNKQSYVDSAGVVFSQNYSTDPSVQIVDNSGATPISGAAVASNRFLGFVGRVVALAKESGFTVTQVILPPDTTRELEVRIKEGDYLVKLSIDRPAGEQVEDMHRAVGYFVINGQKPEYIDVRVSGKAFYK